MLLTPTDENFMRLLLLLEIGRKAIQIKFDKEFHPEVLHRTIIKNHNKLNKFKKKNIITNIQWQILKSESPTSAKFDIPLLIMFLKHFTEGQLCIHDNLPGTSDTSVGADIARIKFYRNYIAHLNTEVDVKDERFFEIWNNISQSITRLAGELKEECYNALSRRLDFHHNYDLKLKFDNIMHEIQDLKATYVSLKEAYNKLQEYQSDPVPPNVRVQFARQLKNWKKDSFVQTTAAREIMKTVTQEHCVAIIGSFGVGKTAILRQVAMKMQDDRFCIMPVTSVSEIVKYYCSEKRCVFVVDDFCGKYEINATELDNFRNCHVPFSENCKIIVSCRLQVYLSIKSHHIKFVECNLNSSNLRLSKRERLSLAEMCGIDKTIIGSSLLLYDCFPRLCRAYKNQSKQDFFQNPHSIFEWELEMLGYCGKYCALLLLVMFNNELKVAYMSDEASEDTKEIIAKACNVCKIPMAKANETILDELFTLIQTFLKLDGDMFCALDENVLYLIINFFSKEKMGFLIEHGSLALFGTRIKLAEINNKDFTISKEINLTKYEDYPVKYLIWEKYGKNTIILPREYYQTYLKRMVKYWQRGNVNATFMNPNSTHSKFLDYVNHLSISDQRSLARKKDKKDGRTPLLAFTAQTAYTNHEFYSDCVYVDWLLCLGVEVNACDFQGYTSLINAASTNSLLIVRKLIRANANVNMCTEDGISALFISCQNGFRDIARILIESDADCNTCSNKGTSALQVACIVKDKTIERTDIVKDLLKHGANVNYVDNNGISALHNACWNGYVTVVTELLRWKADVNRCDAYGRTPIQIAYQQGHREIYMILRKYQDESKTT